jgi:glyoxylase-like metal-dependent hydrolase (beta-lactamase superfamily II)
MWREFSVLLCSLLTVSAAFGGTECLTIDFDGDGSIGPGDLAVLLAQWGEPDSVADIDNDGTVGPGDLAALLALWGEAGHAPGSFPAMWINGGPNCPSQGGFEPPIQIHQFNDSMYILRQSLCTNFEAPFMYLLFGEDKVLLQDTGAGGIQIGPAVYGIIDDWLKANGKDSIDLIVTHSHGHGDHIQGDSQFNGQPNTTVVGTSVAAVTSFFGFTDWPNDVVEYDLGGRILDVIPIPGHHPSHIALYDRATGILFTGDTLYPGRLYFPASLVNTYEASIQRLVDFTADKPVCHVLGTHIEMSTTPGVDFPIGSTYHPNEHILPLRRDHLLELLDAVEAMLDDPFIDVHDDFIVYPLGLLPQQ